MDKQENQNKSSEVQCQSQTQIAHNITQQPNPTSNLISKSSNTIQKISGPNYLQRKSSLHQQNGGAIDRQNQQTLQTENGENRFRQIVPKNTRVIDLVDDLARIGLDSQDQSQQQHQQQSNQDKQQSIDLTQQLNIKKCNIKDIPGIYKKYPSFYQSISDQFRYRMEQIMIQVQSFGNDDDSVCSDSQQHQQFGQQEAIQKEQKSVKQCSIESARYLVGLFCLDSPRIIVSFIVILVLTAIQLNYELDKKCDLQKLYEKRVKKNLDIDCPYDSYILLNLQNMFSFICVYCMSSLWMINLYQLSYRRMVCMAATVLMIVQILIDIYFQTLGDLKLFNELQIVIVIIFFGYSFLNQHSIGIIVQRYLQIQFYQLITICVILLIVQVRDNRSFYWSIVLQNVSYIVKKVSHIYLRNRLKSNLQYDDITLFYIAIIALEYVFIFDYLLIQSNPPIQQTISALNFIIIQIQNINNKNIFYLVYNYFKTQGMKRMQGIVGFNYALVILLIMYDYMSYLVNGLFLFGVFSVYMKFVSIFLSKNNRNGEIEQLKAILNNKYFQQKIDESELNDYTCQQSILGYYVFLTYQILLIIIKTLFQTNKNVDVQFQLIYHLEKTTGNQLTISNVVIFNILVAILIFTLVGVKSRGEVKIVKQATKYSIFVFQFIGFTGMVTILNMRLFQYGYTKQTIQLW